MIELELVFPTKIHETVAAEYYQEHLTFGESVLHGDSGLDSANSYDEWLEKIHHALHTEIRSIIFFAFRKSDNKMIGTINIRYPYEGYVQVHGHIGYGVRPSERKKGHATAMLRLALAHCKEIGLKKVLLTCDKSNIASSKTIGKCFGTFESESLQSDATVLQRYWISI